MVSKTMTVKFDHILENKQSKIKFGTWKETERKKHFNIDTLSSRSQGKNVV